MSAAELLSIAAGVISLAAFVVYWIAIFRKEENDPTRPSRTTWWILTFLDIIITLTYWESGGQETVWLPFSLTFCSLITAILAIWWGMGGKERLDIFCFAGAILSIPLWILYGAKAALWLTVALDIIALAPTIQKSWYHPETEDRFAWALTGVAVTVELVALFFVEKLTLEIALYPIHIFWMDMLIMVILFLPRRNRKPLARPVHTS